MGAALCPCGLCYERRAIAISCSVLPGCYHARITGCQHFCWESPSMPRIASLIASATEIVCALGLEDQLVGRSHECDFPESVKRLPVCTAPKFNIEGSSYDIDQ